MLTFAISCFGQSHRANHWAFPRGNGIDFSSGTPIPEETAIPAFGSLTQGTSSISDENGDLILYCNGDSAWNNQHDVISGGNNLAGSEEATQSSIIIPFPNSPDRYIIFTMDDNGFSDGLHYYVADMSLNGGAGLIFPGTQLDSNMTEKLCAVKHANDFDYWIVAHRFDSDEFTVYHVDSFGVNTTPVVSAVGITHQGNTNAVMGQMKISPDGSKIALASFQGGHIELLSFNNETGEVSAPLTLQNYAANFPFGVEFSPDSRKLFYVQRFSSVPEAILFQYDLDHLDTNCLLASEFELASVNQLKVPSNLQLANNGKIYMTVNYFSTYDTLAVINKPNLYGFDADFDEFGLSLDSAITEGMVNFPSTYLSDGIYVSYGTTCDGETTVMYPEDSINLDSVRWDFGDPLSGSNESTDLVANHVFSSPDTFQVQLTVFNGNQVDTFYRNVIIWDTAEHILGRDTTICNGGADVVLDASWYNACHVWSDGSTDDTLVVNSGGLYWVDVFYQSCHFRDTITVEGVNGPPQFSLGEDTSVCNNFNFVIDPDLANTYYTWQDGSHDTTFTVTNTGIYSLSATNACGSTVDTLLVTVNIAAQPVVEFPTDTTVCDTLNLTLNVAFEDAVYSWSDGSSDSILVITTAGLYAVTVANICDTVSDTIQVEFESPISTLSKDIDLLCTPSDSLILATVNLDTVTWSNGSTSSQYAIANPGTYWFNSENSCGSQSDTIQIIEWDTGYALNIGGDTVVCAGTENFFVGLDTNAFAFDLLWSTGARSQTISVNVGQYSLFAANRCAALEDDIIVKEPESIQILANKLHTICEGEEVILEVSLTDYKSISWSDGSSKANLEITNAGIYDVSLTDTNGCILSDSISYNDDCPALVELDNVFTPNSDGVNDLYCLRVENVQESIIEIYNRWGTLLHQGTTGDLCWDGFVKGEKAVSGIYFYQAVITDLDGKEIEYRGSFSLLR